MLHTPSCFVFTAGLAFRFVSPVLGICKLHQCPHFHVRYLLSLSCAPSSFLQLAHVRAPRGISAKQCEVTTEKQRSIVITQHTVQSVGPYSPTRKEPSTTKYHWLAKSGFVERRECVLPLEGCAAAQRGGVGARDPGRGHRGWWSGAGGWGGAAVSVGGRAHPGGPTPGERLAGAVC